MIRTTLRRLAFKLSSQIALSPVLRYPMSQARAIFMFHEVQDDVVGELDTGCTPQFLGLLLRRIRTLGLDIISLDEALERMAGRGKRGFVVLTFDDGYRDTLTRALPVLEEHNAPFVVYVPTQGITREIDAWWLGLREIFKQFDTVTIDAMGRKFECSGATSKVIALRQACVWAARNSSASGALGPMFSKYGVSILELVNRYFLDAEELVRLSQHPLATIGTHSVSHAPLSTLNLTQMHSEIRESRAFLQTLINMEVRHLAYPFGSKSACGEREFDAARDMGLASAVTAVNRPLLGQPSRYALPRMNPSGEFWMSFVDHNNRDEAAGRGYAVPRCQIQGLRKPQPLRRFAEAVPNNKSRPLQKQRITSW